MATRRKRIAKAEAKGSFNIDAERANGWGKPLRFDPASGGADLVRVLSARYRSILGSSGGAVSIIDLFTDDEILAARKAETTYEKFKRAFRPLVLLNEAREEWEKRKARRSLAARKEGSIRGAETVARKAAARRLSAEQCAKAIVATIKEIRASAPRRYSTNADAYRALLARCVDDMTLRGKLAPLVDPAGELPEAETLARRVRDALKKSRRTP